MIRTALATMIYAFTGSACVLVGFWAGKKMGPWK